MARTRTLWLALLTAVTLAGSGCAPFVFSHVPMPIPVPPWVSERMEDKYTSRFKERTPVMPPILPGTPPVTCMDPPSDEEVIRALPKVARGIPFVYEEFRDNFTVITELIVDQVDPCTFVPLLGPAQLHHCHYKCTVYYKERIVSGYPFPFTVENDRVQVVYIDKDHFHLCVGPEQQMQRSVTRDLSGP